MTLNTARSLLARLTRVLASSTHQESLALLERLEVEGGLEGGEAGSDHAVVGIGGELEQLIGGLVPDEVHTETLRQVSGR